MLARFGRDVAGAAVVSEHEPAPRKGYVEAYDHPGLAAEVAGIGEHPLALHDDSELSLAGLQDKLLLVGTGTGWGRGLLEAADRSHEADGRGGGSDNWVPVRCCRLTPARRAPYGLFRSDLTLCSVCQMMDMTISEVRDHLGELVRQVTHEPVYVTKHGRRAMVVLDAGHYDAMVERLENLEDVAAARAARDETGDSIPWEDVKRELGL